MTNPTHGKRVNSHFVLPPRKTADRIAQGGTDVLSSDVGRRISMNEWVSMVSLERSDILAQGGEQRDTQGEGSLIQFVGEMATNED